MTRAREWVSSNLAFSLKNISTFFAANSVKLKNMTWISGHTKAQESSYITLKCTSLVSTLIIFRMSRAEAHELFLKLLRYFGSNLSLDWLELLDLWHIFNDVFSNLPEYKPALFYCAFKILVLFLFFFFKEIEGLWQLGIKEVYWFYFFNSICSLHISVPHFGNSENILNFFIITIMVVCGK